MNKKGFFYKIWATVAIIIFFKKYFRHTLSKACTNTNNHSAYDREQNVRKK